MTENIHLKLSTYMHKKETKIHIMAYYADKLRHRMGPRKTWKEGIHNIFREKRWNMTRNLCLRFAMWISMCNISTPLFGKAPCRSKSPGIHWATSYRVRAQTR